MNNDISVRKKKLIELRKFHNAYPNDFRRDFISDQLHKKYGNKSNNELILENVRVHVAGRMVNRRILGRISFVILQDMGGQIQLYIVHDRFPLNFYDEVFKKWDIGDILGACGVLFKTRTGELSINCNNICLLTKSLRSLPNKFHGLIDKEIKYRQRYLDLIANEQSRKIFKYRSLIIMEIRRFMVEHEFIEVETPMMQDFPGGATARPFITNHNTLHMDLYLRVSPELYLKRLVVGGFEKVFEINRSFRNEGLSSVHNPEFTMLELYMAYVDHLYLMEFIEELFYTISKHILGTSIIEYGSWTFDLSKPFLRMSMKESIYRYNPHIKDKDIDNLSSVTDIAISLGVQVDPKWSVGHIQTAIFEEVVVQNLIYPTFITSYPIEVSPLARRNDFDSSLSDRFELFFGGNEIVNGFSELNDSEDQKLRFLEQVCLNDNNDGYIKKYDEDYIVALEYGLPPTAGVGVGIDRLVMLLTNTHTIRDVILFPILRSIK